MCTSPRTFKHIDKVSGVVSYNTVPCGRCSECRSLARGEVATRSVIEANRSGSLYLCTFTYRNSAVPLAFVERLVEYGEVVHQSEPFFPSSSFDRDFYIKLMNKAWRCSPSYNSKYPNALFPISYCSAQVNEDVFLDVVVTPSLERKDLRLSFKRARVAYQREVGDICKFSYLCFGEYGDVTSRPHFHVLLYGLNFRQLKHIVYDWEKHFGHVDYVKVKQINPDGSPGFVKASKYISKYVSKSKFSLNGDLEGFVQKPRKLSSLKFGRLSDDDLSSLRSYYLAFDVNGGFYNPSSLVGFTSDPFRRSLVLSEILRRRKRITIDGQNLIFPLYEQRKIYSRSYRLSKSYFLPDGSEKRTFFCTRQVYKQSALQVLLADFARNCFIEDVTKKFFGCAPRDVDLSDREAIEKFCLFTKSSLEDREKTSEKVYLKSLNTQHYA